MQQIPDDTLLIIFTFLNLDDLCFRIPLVNSSFYDVSKRNPLWATLLHRTWLLTPNSIQTELPKNISEKMSNKEIYREMTKFYSGYSTVYGKIKQFWNAMSAWTKSQTPLLHSTLNFLPILSQQSKHEEVEKAFNTLEEKLQTKISSEIRCFYRICNGQNDLLAQKYPLYGCYQFYDKYGRGTFLPVSHILEYWQEFEKFSRSRNRSVAPFIQNCIPISIGGHLNIFVALKTFHSTSNREYPANSILHRSMIPRVQDWNIIHSDFLQWNQRYLEKLQDGWYDVKGFPLDNNEINDADDMEDEEETTINLSQLSDQIIRFPSIATDKTGKQLGSDTTTRGVRIQCNALAIMESVEGNKGQFLFAYRVRISMAANENPSLRCQLHSRYWKITETETGQVDEVRGEGVIGFYPKVYPGSYFEYCSCTSVMGGAGWMEGSFSFYDSNGKLFDAKIDPFPLDNSIHF